MSNMIERTWPASTTKTRPAGAKVELWFVDDQPTVRVTAYGLADGVSQQNVGSVDDILPLLSSSQRTELKVAMRVLFDKVIEANGGTLVTDDDPTLAI